jgi:hypothetical protein
MTTLLFQVLVLILLALLGGVWAVRFPYPTFWLRPFLPAR